MVRKYLPIILILLLAFALRGYQLTEVPPGLTHDEANHGRDSINILDGTLLFYFPLNYGSEPLYNYVVAGAMALIGESLYALRLVNVLFGLLAIAAAYLWVTWAFDRRTAVVTAGLLAVSFWPLATSRQALRAGMLPFLMTLGVIAFWYLLRWAQDRIGRKKTESWLRVWWAVLALAIAIAATLHNYLAARVLWLLYPIFLVYLAGWHRSIFRLLWRPVVVGLVGAGLLVIPMFTYVQAHPEAETRLQMLDRPLQAFLAGELAPIFKNAGEALLAFFWPGFGDHFLAYNIPGRPVFAAITAVFFGLGLLISIWRWRQPAYAFLLLWFGIGILPSLITGPEANTTRNLGALVPTFVLPAVGFSYLAQAALSRWGRPARLVMATSLVLWLVIVLTTTSRDYFERWANSPDVRAAYQHTLIEALDYLARQASNGTTVISSVYPGPAHDPSIARMILPDDGEDLRWIDGRYGLILPGGAGAKLIVPASTPLHPAFSPMVQVEETISLRENDLDPSFTIYRIVPQGFERLDPVANFGDALQLVSARWLSNPSAPGQTAELLTTWEVIDPVAVGPLVPPAFETDLVLFSQVLAEDGDVLTQRDSLEAPSWDWQAGDRFIQIHPLMISADARPGVYPVIVGAYDRSSGLRLPLLDQGGIVVDDRFFVVPLTIDES